LQVAAEDGRAPTGELLPTGWRRQRRGGVSLGTEHSVSSGAIGGEERGVAITSLPLDEREDADRWIVGHAAPGASLLIMGFKRLASGVVLGQTRHGWVRCSSDDGIVGTPRAPVAKDVDSAAEMLPPSLPRVKRLARLSPTESRNRQAELAELELLEQRVAQLEEFGSVSVARVLRGLAHTSNQLQAEVHAREARDTARSQLLRWFTGRARAQERQLLEDEMAALKQKQQAVASRWQTSSQYAKLVRARDAQRRRVQAVELTVQAEARLASGWGMTMYTQKQRQIANPSAAATGREGVVHSTPSMLHRRGAMSPLESLGTASPSNRLSPSSSSARMGRRRAVVSGSPVMLSPEGCGAHHAMSLPTDTLSVALRMARSYPEHKFGAVLDKELARLRDEAAKEQSLAAREAAMKQLQRSGRLEYELAHEGLPRAVRAWNSGHAQHWLLRVLCASSDHSVGNELASQKAAFRRHVRERVVAHGLAGEALLWSDVQTLVRMLLPSVGPTAEELTAAATQRKALAHALEYLRYEVAGKQWCSEEAATSL
jgi:hypothetical protein